MKHTLANQDKTKISKAIDTYFYHTRRQKRPTVSIYKEREHNHYAAFKEALNLICPGKDFEADPLLPEEVRRVQFLKKRRR